MMAGKGRQQELRAAGQAVFTPRKQRVLSHTAAQFLPFMYTVQDASQGTVGSIPPTQGRSSPHQG